MSFSLNCLRLVACLLWLALLVTPAFARVPPAPNLLRNGDFERVFQGTPAEWGGNEGLKSARGGTAKSRCLQTALAFVQDAQASQYLSLNGRRIREVRLSVRAKWRNVRQGAEPPHCCRAMLLFFTAAGGQVGETVDLGKWTGTRAWRLYSGRFAVPPQTVRARVTFGLVTCTGAAWFDDAHLEVTKGDHSYRTPRQSRTDTRGWYALGKGNSAGIGVRGSGIGQADVKQQAANAKWRTQNF